MVYCEMHAIGAGIAGRGLANLHPMGYLNWPAAQRLHSKHPAPTDPRHPLGGGGVSMRAQWVRDG